MKKLMLLAVLTISYLVAQPVKHENPLPTCDPCPWVR